MITPEKLPLLMLLIVFLLFILKIILFNNINFKESLKRINIMGIAIAICLAMLGLTVKDTNFAIGLLLACGMVAFISIERKDMDID
jgi:hypothetical protein